MVRQVLIDYSAKRWFKIVSTVVLIAATVMFFLLNMVTEDISIIIVGLIITIGIFGLLSGIYAMLDKQRNKISSELEEIKLFSYNLHSSNYKNMPFGNNVIYDIKKSFFENNFGLIFDVGANTGQSASFFSDLFPESKIYCFEPSTNAFQNLENNLKDYQNVECYKIALGDSVKEGRITSKEASDQNHVLSQPNLNDIEVEDTESIKIITLDKFCKEKKISKINFLKIDTEGGDLDVLKGAKRMLRDQSIEFVQVEAGMSHKNDLHVSFEDLKRFLEKHNYVLFGIYDQVKEWPSNKAHLRRTNSVFVSSQKVGY